MGFLGLGEGFLAMGGGFGGTYAGLVLRPAAIGATNWERLGCGLGWAGG